MTPPLRASSTAVGRYGPLAFIAALLIVWQLALGFQRASILPTPWAVGKALIELAVSGRMLRYVVASLFRVTWGFVLAAVLAIPLGLTLGWYRRAELAFNPIIQILRPISPLAWIPISILWFGVGDRRRDLSDLPGSFLPLTLTAMNAVAGIPDVLSQRRAATSG